MKLTKILGLVSIAGKETGTENYRVSNLRVVHYPKTLAEWYVPFSDIGKEIFSGGLTDWRLGFTIGDKGASKEEYDAIRNSIAKIEYKIGLKTSLNAAEDWNYFNGAPFGAPRHDAVFNSLYSVGRGKETTLFTEFSNTTSLCSSMTEQQKNFPRLLLAWRSNS